MLEEGKHFQFTAAFASDTVIATKTLDETE